MNDEPKRVCTCGHLAQDHGLALFRTQGENRTLCFAGRFDRRCDCEQFSEDKRERRAR